MKKSLIALAVAGAFAAPAFAASSNVDAYGVVNIAIQKADCLGAGCLDDMTVLDNTSRIGFKGAEDLGGGLKAVWQIESALGGNGAVMGGGTLASRNTFIGLAGGFGTFVMGRHDTPYKLGTGKFDIFGDTIADYNLGRLNGVQGLSNAHDHRTGQAIAYISPTFGGFHAAVAVVASNGEAGSALNNAGDDFDALSMTGIYTNGPLFVSLSYQDVNADLTALAGNQDSSAWKLGVGYKIADIDLGVVYESSDVGTTTEDRDVWQLTAAYAMGPVTLKAQYIDVSNANWGVTAGADQSMWALGVDYSMSKRTTAYFVYGSGDSDKAVGVITAPAAAGGFNVMTAAGAGDVSGFNIGIKHSF